MIQTVEALIQLGGVSTFIETGTYLGYTCRYIASRNPQLPIITIENAPSYYEASQTVLREYSNVTSILGNSAEEIDQIVKSGLAGLPLFFLDAHWYDYLPLPDEMQSIGKYLSTAVMVIHDFQIPGRDDYGYDICNGRAIGIEMLRASLAADKAYELFLPCYTYLDAYHSAPANGSSLRGHALLFQAAPLAVAEFARSEHARHYTRQAL